MQLSEGRLQSNWRHEIEQHVCADALAIQVQHEDVGVSKQIRRKLLQLIRRHLLTAVSLAQVDDGEAAAAAALQHFLQVRFIVCVRGGGGGRAVGRTRLWILWLHEGREVEQQQQAEMSFVLKQQQQASAAAAAARRHLRILEGEGVGAAGRWPRRCSWLTQMCMLVHVLHYACWQQAKATGGACIRVRCIRSVISISISNINFISGGGGGGSAAASAASARCEIWY